MISIKAYTSFLAWVIILFVTLCTNTLRAQSTQPLLGKVSYVSISSYYLRFENTESMQIGDTLFIQTTLNSTSTFQAAFIVKGKSSSSLLCEDIGDVPIEKDTEVFYFDRKKKTKPKASSDETKEKSTTALMVDSTASKESVETAQVKRKNIYGRISLYDDFILSSTTDQLNRAGARISLNYDQIAQSKFSFASNFYVQNYQRSKNPTNAAPNFLGLYQLEVNYEDTNGWRGAFGRTSIQNLPSIGWVDGFTLEKRNKYLNMGAFAGFRPSFNNFLFDPNLFQYGVYTGLSIQKEVFSSKTTLGFIDQKFMWGTDRRFLAAQHNLNLNSRWNFFGSAELDLFALQSDSSSLNTLRMSSLFLSLNYKASKKLRLFASYDNRRSIIYYRSYFDLLPNLFDQDYVRQGLRLRANYNITKRIVISLSYNSRFKVDQLRFQNAQGSLAHSNILGGSMRYSYNLNLNPGYMYGQIHSLNYTYRINSIKLSLMTYYRLIYYRYIKYDSKPPYQHFAGIGLGKDFKNRINLSCNAEYYIQKYQNTTRINLRLTKSFGQ